MQVLFLMWLALAGMKDVLWEGGLEPAAPLQDDTTQVDAAEGPIFPPKP